MDNDALSYVDYINKTNINTHKLVLKKYKDKLQNTLDLKGDTPIFLDTNVLLKSYSISFEARETLLKFYKEYKTSIYLTQQVQLEFTKNREDIIERFFEDVTKGLPSSFNQNILNHFKSFLEKNKTILVDYKNFEKSLKKIESNLTKLSESLEKDIKKKKNENSDILLNDSFLEVFSSCNCLSSTQELITKAKTEFDTLKKSINSEKIDSEIKKLGNVFPGMGDIKQKPNNPYGDFILYHELMEYSTKNKTDIIFLTYDTTKGDWMKFNKQPHIHYIENFYLNTGQIIYILDAKRILEESLNINFTSLINLLPTTFSDTKIHSEDIKDFLLKKFPTAKLDGTFSLDELCEELIYNGYSDLEKVEFEADRADRAFINHLNIEYSGNNGFTSVGNLRMRLKIFNKDYFMLSKSTGNYEKAKSNLHEKYKHLL